MGAGVFANPTGARERREKSQRSPERTPACGFVRLSMQYLHVPGCFLSASLAAGCTGEWSWEAAVPVLPWLRGAAAPMDWPLLTSTW